MLIYIYFIYSILSILIPVLRCWKSFSHYFLGYFFYVTLSMFLFLEFLKCILAHFHCYFSPSIISLCFILGKFFCTSFNSLIFSSLSCLSFSFIVVFYFRPWFFLYRFIIGLLCISYMYILILQILILFMNAFPTLCLIFTHSFFHPYWKILDK